MTKVEALEIVRGTYILEGVFDHDHECKAPDYSECTCGKKDRDEKTASLVYTVDREARINELRRMPSHTITDLRAYVNDRIAELEKEAKP